MRIRRKIKERIREDEMEPLLNPWVFYLMEIFEGLKIFFLTIGCVGLPVLITMGAISKEENELDWEDKDERKILKRYIKGIIIAIIIIFMGIFIPSKSTIAKMIIAQNVTKDNVVKVLEIGNDIKKEFKNDIIEMIKEIKGNEKKDE